MKIKPIETKSEIEPTENQIKEKQNKDATACFSCGDDRSLQMLAHRKSHSIVGWLFVCSVCLKDLLGQIVRIELSGSQDTID